MLVPGGIFSMIDIKAGSNQVDNLDHPLGPFLYTVSLMHCMPVGLNDNGTGTWNDVEPGKSGSSAPGSRV